jgi:hypothetical protein
MKTIILTVTLLVALLSGCAANRQASLTTPFDKAQAQRMLEPGANSIRGSALMRQVGGGVVTCAGGQVFLMPVTEAAKEWATTITTALLSTASLTLRTPA